ncbi:MAG TPA: oxidoreductase, partial [Gammaproteobacteria bacterium]|nr:oxidoreductase [Gammaproteobacteria bacterium]
MKIELTGKQSLVTGSTAGIGLAIAQGLGGGGGAGARGGRRG